MDHSSEIADFLRTRRARISPESAGLPPTDTPASSPACAARRPPASQA
ncbi:hypothetical protein [Streptomyces sp. NPDC046984]